MIARGPWHQGACAVSGPEAQFPHPFQPRMKVESHFFLAALNKPPLVGLDPCYVVAGRTEDEPLSERKESVLAHDQTALQAPGVPLDFARAFPPRIPLFLPTALWKPRQPSRAE